MPFYPCSVCGSPVEMFPSQREKRQYVFCSHKCLNTPFVEKECATCGKTFKVVIKGANGARFCSTECHNAKQRERHAAGKYPIVTKVCKACGKPFDVRRSFAVKQMFCSKQCFHKVAQRKSGTDNPKWKPKITVTCAYCGKAFDTYPCRTDRKYCCQEHGKLGNLRRLAEHPRTNLEIAMADALRRASLHFSEQVTMCDRWMVDFLLSDYPIIIQCDGLYWHDRQGVKDRDRGQDRYLANAGYIVLRFTDKQILHYIDACIRTIKRTIANHQLPLIPY